MIRFSPPTLFKFLIGVLLVQAATAIQVVAALSTGGTGTWLLFTTLSVTSGVFAALWFSSIARHRSRETLFEAHESLSREREKIRVKAERDKTRLVGRAESRLARASNQARSKANLKAGAAIAGLVGVSAVMLLAQLFSLGLLALTTAGGALAGYTAGRYQAGRLRRSAESGRLATEAPPLRVVNQSREPPATTPTAEREKLGRARWAR
jgi:hypothetical protein